MANLAIADYYLNNQAMVLYIAPTLFQQVSFTNACAKSYQGYVIYNYFIILNDKVEYLRYICIEQGVKQICRKFHYL